MLTYLLFPNSIHHPLMGVKVRSILIVFVSLLFVIGVSAQENSIPSVGTDIGIRLLPFVTLQNHGYFRFRFNEFYHLDLGIGGASGFQDPLDTTKINRGMGRQSSTIENANMRFRYEPSLMIGEFMTVSARIDFLDNMIFGSNPYFGTVNSPISFFSRTQVPPSSGSSGFKDAVNLKSAYADVRIFQRLHMMVGRIPEHFGLGILRSDGTDVDSDYGDFVDAIAFHVRLPAARFRLQMEFPGEGTAAESPFRLYGPTHDPEQKDDINRWVLVFDSSPIEKEEFEEHVERLFVKRKPTIDWGMYHAFTKQSLSSDKTGGTLPVLCGTGVNKNFGLAYDCYTLTPRNAFFWTPSFWGRLLWRPSDQIMLRLEAEMVFVYGYVEYMQSFLDTSKGNTKKDFLEFGTAFEAELRFYKNIFTLMTGVASGDGSSRYFGILDQHILVAPDDLKYSLYPSVTGNARVTNYVFNRDYRIDSILFREVIGGITNAIYVKPGYSRYLYKNKKHELSGYASCLIGLSAVPEGTPGQSRALGIETNVGVSYKLGTHLKIKADGAILFPLGGLRIEGTSEDPTIAFAFRTLVWAGF